MTHDTKLIVFFLIDTFVQVKYITRLPQHYFNVCDVSCKESFNKLILITIAEKSQPTPGGAGESQQHKGNNYQAHTGDPEKQ